MEGRITRPSFFFSKPKERIFTMKKIDTESKNYQLVKGGVGFIGAIGSMICLDSVVLTFVRALFPKSKLVNSVAGVGCIGLNMVVGLIGKEGTELVFDQYAYVFNDIADRVNGEEPKPEKEPITVPSRNATPAEDWKYVSDVVLKAEPFSFKTEEEARKAFEGLRKTVDVMGFANLPWYAKIANKDLGVKGGDSGYDILSLYGWKSKDLVNAGIDKIRDDEYILDIFTYHDISDVFNILKED